MDAKIRATGYLTITLTDHETGLVRVINTPNKVVDTGLQFLATRAVSPYETRKIDYMAIGTSSQPVAGTDTALVALAASEPLTGLSASGGVITATCSFNEGVGTADITELGLFLNDDTLFARTVIPVQTKSSTTSMDVVWTITFQPV
jgi:hypothetical protein